MFITFLLILQAIVFAVAFPYLFGLSEKDRYAFRKYMADICKKEKVYLHYCYDVDELNKNVFGKNVLESEKAAGAYIHVTNSTELENNDKKYPRIYLTKKPSVKFHINSFNQTINVMTFAHELGHHFSIKENNDRSEKAADRYAIKLFKEFFPKYKSILYFGLLTHYLNRNKIYKKRIK